jgi:chromosome segregation ATPase
VPADRLVEQAQLAQSLAEKNLVLLARIKDLETQIDRKAAAVNETMRDVDAANAVTARTHADLEAARARLREVEREDVDTLKAVIEAVEKLLGPPAGRREP